MWALAPMMVPTNSVRKPERTASVAISAKTASATPTKLMIDITLTPPSRLRARR